MLSCKPQDSPKIKVLSNVEYKAAINKDVQLVDVRTDLEYKDGAINHAINIDVNGEDFESKIQNLDKTKPVYVYCRSGKRSQKAAHKMIELGFTQVIDLDGGYLAWTN